MIHHSTTVRDRTIRCQPLSDWTTHPAFGYKRSVRKIFHAVVAVAAFCAVVWAADFTWDWRNQDVIARTDPALNTTSQLTEPQRAELLNAVVALLDKPLAARGYDNDRIREIASTTRLRFVELGEGKPVILATSLGIEGGCDVLVNCPFWIFRQDKKGYVLMLQTVAATYTKQPTASDGYSDLVIARRDTPSETRLTVYKYTDGKYSEAGCYTATFAPAAEGEGIANPAISPCGAQSTEPPKEGQPAEEPKGSPQTEPKSEEVH
jgi:hypothetical protein